jgi:hypothetical protein
VRLTIDRSLTDTDDVEVEAVAGASLAQVLDGLTSRRAWCGQTLLDPSHQAGTYPLLHGARLRDGPGPHTASIPGLHLAAIAGPDAGAVIAVDGPVTVGSAPGGHGMRDDAMDPRHLLVEPAAAAALTCKDLDSTNGTGWWRRDGERWRWRGYRRRFVAHVGDVISIGNTALQVRDDGASELNSSVSRFPGAVARWHATLPWTPTAGWEGLPDPTAVGAWTCSVHLTGPHARDAARAMILARGRRPPLPMPFHEDWLLWLPAALPGDGAISCGASPASADVTLEAHATQCLLLGGTDATPRFPIAVSSQRADALARAVAGASAQPWPDAVRWADIDVQRTHDSASAGLRVTLGVVCSPALQPWSISLDEHAAHLLVAGTRRSGASTLLATLVGGLASHYDEHQLRMVLTTSGSDGPLAPCALLPHVDRAAGSANGGEALLALEGVLKEARRRGEALRDSGWPDWSTWEASGEAPARVLVVVDDFDEITGGSRAASAALEHLASHPVYVGVHLALATHRPAGAVTPMLRASCAHAVALRVASESDSLGMVGVADAATLDEVPGRAVTRIAGKSAIVQAALPEADASARVRRVGVDAPPGRHLAEAVILRAGQGASIAPVLP